MAAETMRLSTHSVWSSLLWLSLLWSPSMWSSLSLFSMSLQSLPLLFQRNYPYHHHHHHHHHYHNHQTRSLNAALFRIQEHKQREHHPHSSPFLGIRYSTRSFHSRCGKMKLLSNSSSLALTVWE